MKALWWQDGEGYFHVRFVKQLTEGFEQRGEMRLAEELFERFCIALDILEFEWIDCSVDGHEARAAE